ncbi:PLP-dependent aminotransferase family protein [Xanthobacter sp. DSM 24535]|uniref:aminotransferase-like domain-containing protein n=1 Tax=Roseixanthobacter psychrophilus TaxID=3119917 RepID=UPI003729342E
MTWQPNISGSKKPKYLALVDALERDIRSGVLRDGERLPPQREIAAGLDITIATLTKAIQEAARRGLVTAKTGSGTFVRGADETPAANRQVFDLSLNTVPSAPSKPFIDAALEAIARRRDSETLFGYEPAAGSEAHRAMMAKWLSQNDFAPTPDSLLLTHGGQHALAACFHALTRPGDVILCEQWAYTGIRRLAELCHVRIEGVAMDEEGLDPDDLAAKLRKTSPRFVICSATLQNPTTATMSLERRRKIVAACAAANVLLVEDDIYGALAGVALPPLAALAGDRVIYVSSVSKCLAPGARLGALVAPDDLIPALQNALMSLHWTGPTLWAELFGHMLEAGTVERCIAAQQKEALHRLALFRDVVGIPASTTLPSYHTWLRIPESWSVDGFMAGLLTAGIRVSPAQHFAVSPPFEQAGQFIRLCLGGGDDIELLKEQLRRFRTVLSGGTDITATIT